MRLILLTFMVCANILAADPRRTTEPEAMNYLRSKPTAAKSKRTFHPFRFLRRLGNAESEFALRLSSWGIQREVEAGNSEALPRPSSLTDTSTSVPQGPPGTASDLQQIKPGASKE